MSKVVIKSVFIADEIEKECVECLQNAGLRVVKKTKLGEQDLINELKHFDAVIVRSATKITRAVIEGCGGSLKLIGRAGTGVDNIDLETATQYGAIVMNTPEPRYCLQGQKRIKSKKWELGQGRFPLMAERGPLPEQYTVAVINRH
ncbi:d-isomer specific 2-hydroxyacid dehydrogenase, catalytic domain-containing protein [Ditylenchus destructor]|uniref:D-isomer specific 2-hydroxyacid dehydrogenase, catalytic domain-containing protein n=1 Tax=Ditylenchus destructor TaxID=166010 RepID=A0AAD4NKT4_9BILA|nr:d-isomer specific 2-hydroxyacid dehydrogenase, catalytic domain-containing protein [Ditylenchus destructor]